MTLSRRDLWYGLAVLAALWLAGAGSARAQDAVIKGRIVSDRGEPVVGANVFIEELRMTATSSNDGRYTLTVPGARVRGQVVFLRVRGIGFKPASRQLTLAAGEQTVDLTLIYDINLLQAVVVTGVQEATEAVMTPFDVSTVRETLAWLGALDRNAAAARALRDPAVEKALRERGDADLEALAARAVARHDL